MLKHRSDAKNALFRFRNSDPSDRKKTCMAMGERREASILTYALGTEFLILTYKSDIEKIIIFIHLYDLYCTHKVPYYYRSRYRKYNNVSTVWVSDC